MSSSNQEATEQKLNRSVSATRKNVNPISQASLSSKPSPKPDESTIEKKETTTTVAPPQPMASEQQQNNPVINRPKTAGATIDLPTPSITRQQVKSTSFTVSVYALRYFINSKKIKFQAYFRDKVVQDFEEMARFSNDKKRDYYPTMFHLSMNIQIDIDNIPYVMLGRVRHRCENYNLRVEEQTLIFGLFGSPKVDDTTRRSINSNMPQTQFLFNLVFPNEIDKTVLGKLFHYLTDRYA